MGLTTRHMVDSVTYWVYTDANDPNDPYSNGGSWSAPVTVSCEYESGGKVQRGRDGEEFTPSSTYYTTVSVPLGALVVLGSSLLGEPPSNAEEIRKVGGGTSLGFQASEFVWWTG